MKVFFTTQFDEVVWDLLLSDALTKKVRYELAILSSDSRWRKEN
jgi:hypothetical protein